MKENSSTNSRKLIMIAAVVVVIALILVISLSSNSPGKKLAKQLDLGNKYLAELNYEEAIAAFQNVINIDPNNEEAYLGMAEAYVGLDKIDEALAILDMGLAQTESVALKNYQDSLITNNEIMVENSDNDEDTAANNTEEASMVEAEEGQDMEATEKVFLEAADEDFEMLNDYMPPLLSLESYDSTEMTERNTSDWVTSIAYYYLNNNLRLPIRVHEIEMISGTDPKGYNVDGGYIRVHADEIDWIAANVFNIKADMTKFEGFAGEGFDEGIYEFLYRDKDYYYICVDGLGLSESDKVTILEYSQNEGIYDIKLKSDANYGYDNYSSYVDIKTYLKEENGVKYWSILKSEVVDGFDEGISKAVYDEDTIIQACKNYTGAPIVGIDHYDGIKPVVHCYESLVDHTATWDWLTVDPNTLIAVDILESEVDLKPYLPN